MRKELSDEFNAIGPELRDAIAAAAPKDTGRLSEATLFQVSRDELAVHVGYSKNRPGFKRAWKKGGFEALWQEFGTRHHAAQPFISPTFRSQLSRILDRVDTAVNSVLRKAADYGK